jgi:hypothetical protein
MKKLYYSFCILLLFVSPVLMRAQLNGVYTLDNTQISSATNFTSFTQLSATLSASGVNGAVTVNVGATSGPYNEQVVIPQITGASTTNSIVINGNGRTLTYAAGTGTLKSTLQLTGTDFLTINNMTVSATNATNAFAVHLWSGANNNTFNNCLFTAPMAGTGTSLCPFSVSGSSSVAASTGTAGSNITLNTCTTSGGYYGVIFYGSTTFTHSNNAVVNCTVRDFYATGIYAYYMLSPVISNNVIERPNRTTTATGPDGILISTGCTDALIERNYVRRLYDAFTTLNAGGGYGINLSADATAANPNVVRNNIVSNITSNGTQAGIYATAAAYTYMYHNTISLADATSASGTTYGIYCTGPNNRIMNNLIYITRGGSGTKYVLYVTTAAEPTLISDYNALYINSSAGTNNIGDLGASYTTLAGWQTGTGFDLNSVVGDPQFQNAAAMDFTPLSLTVNNKGLAIGILTDFNNTARSPLAPDPGALETYTTACTTAPPSNSFLAPSNSVCPGTVLYFNLQNTNTYTNSGYTVQWLSSGVSVGGFTAIPGATLNSITTPPINVDTYFQAVITCTNGNQSVSTPVGSVVVSAPVTDTIPYYEGFENLAYNGLPNCSWSATNFGSNTRTQQVPQSNSRLPKSGNGYATFENTPAGTNYFYTNPIIFKSGVTYSAALWYITENVNVSNWAELSILIGPNQTATGHTTIATISPVTGNLYNLLSNTFSVAASGQYYVAIKATSASGTSPFLTWDDLSITIPCELNLPPLSVLASTTSICQGQAVSLIASGADTYSWSTGSLNTQISVSPFVTTSYTVTGYDNESGCPAKQMVTITVKTSPQIYAFASFPEICSGQSSTLSASGAQNYYWTNGYSGPTTIVSPTVTTTYSVSGTNTLACSTYTTIQITVLPGPQFNVQPSATLACAGDAVKITASGAATYQWMAPQLFTQGSQITVSPQSSTIYTVIATGTNGCSSVSTVTIAVEMCASLNETTQGGIKVFPNPTSSQVHVVMGTLPCTVQINDITGRKIYDSGFPAQEHVIDMSAFPRGVYFVHLKGDQATVVKIIKE